MAGQHNITATIDSSVLSWFSF